MVPATDKRRNRVPAKEVFELLGFPTEQSMNHVRRRLQQVLNEPLNRVDPYPSFATSHFATEQAELAELEAEARAAEEAADVTRAADLRTAVTTRRADLGRKVRRLEVEFERTHTLVLPRWGGIRYPGSAWTYDLALCAALCEGGTAALLRAGARAEGRGVGSRSGDVA